MNDYMNELLSMSRALRSNQIDWGGGRKGKGRRQRRKGVSRLPRLFHAGEREQRKAAGGAGGRDGWQKTNVGQ